MSRVRLVLLLLSLIMLTLAAGCDSSTRRHTLHYLAAGPGPTSEPYSPHVARPAGTARPTHHRPPRLRRMRPPPRFPAGRWDARQLRDVLYVGDTSRNVVYLTFDDGPVHSRPIAEALHYAGVRATFCINGYIFAEDPRLAPYLVSLGHAVCNHGWSHRDITKMGDQAARWEISATERAASRSGVTTRPYFRPPYGAFNPGTLDLAASLGFRTIRWSVDPQDWKCEVSPEVIVDRVASAVFPGAVVLLHTQGCSTAAAIPGIVAALQARGYAFETLDDLP